MGGKISAGGLYKAMALRLQQLFCIRRKRKGFHFCLFQINDLDDGLRPDPQAARIVMGITASGSGKCYYFAHSGAPSLRAIRRCP
jgi:hypothetical protein